MIQIIRSEDMELTSTLLEIISSKEKTSHDYDLLSDKRKNFSLTLFYIASALPELEGRLESIAKFLAIDIDLPISYTKNWKQLVW